MTSKRLLVAAVMAAVPAFAQPVARPELRMLRFDEDWSKLTTRDDPFDVLKFRSLGSDWTLSSGGSLRLRFEADGNKTLGASPEGDDTALKGRAYAHLEVRHANDFRWFAEVRTADTWISDRSKPVLDHDDPDFQNFFLEGTFGAGTKRPVTVRAGRQELLLGAERLVSPLDWSSTRRTFDGVSVEARTPRTRTVVFATSPVDHEPHDVDSPVDDRFVHGVDVTWTFREGELLEPYLYWLEDGRGLAADEDDGTRGDVTRRTWGVRYARDRDGWIAETEWSLQEGESAHDDVRAYSISATGGRRWKDAPWSPKLTGGVDVASGDSDPTDGTVERFDQLYPSGHAYFGHVDLVGRQNVRAARVQLELQPRADVQWTIALHRFALDSSRDALYNAGGNVVRRDASGKAGRDVATELDLLATWRFAGHHRVSAEVCRWWSDSFIEATGSGDDAWFAWTAYELRF